MILVGLGILANIFYIGGSLIRCPRRTTVFFTLGALTYVAYYCTMGVYAPAITNGIQIIVSLIILRSVRKPVRVFAPLIGSFITIGLLLLQMTTIYETIIIVATLAVLFAFLNVDCYRRYKVGVIGSQICWIAYALIMTDYAMIVTASFIGVSTLFSLLHNLHKDGFFRHAPAAAASGSEPPLPPATTA